MPIVKEVGQGKRNFRNVPKTARLEERFRQFTERVRRRFTGALPKMYKKYSGISALTFYQPNFASASASKRGQLEILMTSEVKSIHISYMIKKNNVLKT